VENCLIDKKKQAELEEIKQEKLIQGRLRGEVMFSLFFSTPVA